MREKGIYVFYRWATIVLCVILVIGLGFFIIRTKNNKNDECVCKEENCSCNEVVYNIDYSFFDLEKNNENMIYSPLSIKYALKMLSEGANGKTKEEIDKLVGNISLTKYANVDDKISLANALFIENNFQSKVNSDYTNNLIDNYNADIKFDSFNSTSNINSWINEKTLGLINNGIDDVSPEDKLILLNALAIKLNFKSPFDMTNTRGEKFYLSDDKEIDATTMYKKTNSEDISYYQDENIKVLNMALEEIDDAKLECMIIMPNKLDELIKDISDDKIKEISDELVKASENGKDGIEIHIPKFNFEYQLDFVKDLNKMGIKEVFTSNADLSNISEDLYVDDAIHKANIEFSEEGIKASAVTAFMMKNSSFIVKQNYDEVIIDHPFVFIIRDKDTNENWFIGKVEIPNLWENDMTNYR